MSLIVAVFKKVEVELYTRANGRLGRETAGRGPGKESLDASEESRRGGEGDRVRVLVGMEGIGEWEVGR